jgi:hypothetical protein
MSKIREALGALKLTLKENSPTILVIGGVVVMGTGTVIACNRTLKLKATIEPHVEVLEEIADPTGRFENSAENKQIAISKASLDVAKLYFLPFVLFVSGSGMVFWGHNIMIKRNATLAVAFTTLKKTFDAYRARVIGASGHTADQYYMNGDRTVSGEEIGADPTKDYSSRDWEASGRDPYNRVFAQQTSDEWENDLGANKFFIGCKQKEAQRLLNRRGYLYLSEVYDSLGFEESDISRVVGWRVSTLPDGSRDIPVVDFGLDKPLPDDWKYNNKREVYLDFNCQGLIVGGKVQKMLESA